jgi:hypothetical protein
MTNKKVISISLVGAVLSLQVEADGDKHNKEEKPKLAPNCNRSESGGGARPTGP